MTSLSSGSSPVRLINLLPNSHSLWDSQSVYQELNTMAENEDIKSLWVKVKEESEKVGLKLNIQKTKTMAFGPITSWKIDGETMETVTGFILGGPQNTADGDCSHEMKRHLLLGSKVMTNLDSILKSMCSCCCQVASVVSDTVWPHRQQPTRLPHPWDSPGKNPGVGCHFLLQCMHAC